MLAYIVSIPYRNVINNPENEVKPDGIRVSIPYRNVINQLISSGSLSSETIVSIPYRNVINQKIVETLKKKGEVSIPYRNVINITKKSRTFREVGSFNPL